MQVITSKENPLIKQICKLKEKKYRNEYGQYLVEGVKLVKEAIEEKADIKHIVINEEMKETGLIEKHLKNGLQTNEFIQVPNSIFKWISEVENPQGILAVIQKKSEKVQMDYSQDIILALDDIQDPGNLGTIIRTADSIGLKQILLSKGTADPYNSKVIRSTMGAIFRVRLVECENFVQMLKACQENKYSILVTSLDTKQSIYDLTLKRKVIVIGNEASGVSKKVLEIADQKVTIPMLGKTESLNASVATGVILYEYVRQNFFMKNNANGKK